jgi:RNA polymerase sigma-70 factor, ECF subfamily
MARLLKFVGSVSASSPNDWQLLSLAREASGRQGHALISLLVARLRPKAYGLALRLVRDTARAEDIVQESLLRLWKSSVVDRGQAELSTYFNQIVIHESMRVLARNKYEITLEQDALVKLADQHQINNESLQYVDDHADGSGLVAIDAAMSKLPDRQRLALVLWAFADASVSDIASQLNIAENAAHQLLHRAKQSMKKQMGVPA